MGSHDASCLLTNLPIRWGDKVIGIEMKWHKIEMPNMYDVRQSILATLQETIFAPEDAKNTLATSRKFEVDPDELKQYTQELVERRTRIKAWIGTHNGYGHLEEVKWSESRDTVWLLVRLDAAQELSVEPATSDVGDQLTTEEIKKIVDTACLLRRGVPLGTGMQHPDLEEMMLHIHAAEAIAKIGRSIIEFHMDEGLW